MSEISITYITYVELHTRIAQVLADFPHLADWQPTCCESPRCGAYDLTDDERRALETIRNARFLLGEDA